MKHHVFYSVFISGFPRILESPWIFCKIFRPGKSWKFKLKVLVSRGICWDADMKIFPSTQF